MANDIEDGILDRGDFNHNHLRLHSEGKPGIRKQGVEIKQAQDCNTGDSFLCPVWNHNCEWFFLTNVVNLWHIHDKNVMNDRTQFKFHM